MSYTVLSNLEDFRSPFHYFILTMANNGEVVQNRTSELLSMYIKNTCIIAYIIHFMLDDRVAQSEPHMRSHFTITKLIKGKLKSKRAPVICMKMTTNIQEINIYKLYVFRPSSTIFGRLKHFVGVCLCDMN